MCGDLCGDRECLLTFIRLAGHIKRDILQPQSIEQSNSSVAPNKLSDSPRSFFSAALGIPFNHIPYFWTALKDFIWAMPITPLSKDDYLLFKEHGWEYAAITLYPPTDICINPHCSKENPLKKEEQRRAVVYTLSDGVQPAWNIHLYCPQCLTNYHNNFSVCGGIRTYYAGIPSYVLVGEHQFVETRVVRMWTSQMLLGWFSATNAARQYELALADQSNYLSGWPLGGLLNTKHVWDGFTVVSLLDDHITQGTVLHAPHTGSQTDRFKSALRERNKRIALNGQPDAVRHCCDKCMRVYDLENGESRKVQAIVADGISMGRPCCGVFRCIEPLQNNQHRFCTIHFDQHEICAVIGCNHPVSDESKTCSDRFHREMEKKNKERGTAAFTLKERLKHAQISHPQDSLTISEHIPAHDVQEHVEWFEINQNRVDIFNEKNPGSVGVVEDSDPCSTKSAVGNRKFKAQFGRRRTHNEQTLVRPCGIIFARATFYGAEAVSNFLIMLKNAFSVPGARKPEHVFYDTNCDAKQQADASKDPWFKDVGMCVDVWHFLNKHKVTHEYCQKNCNPAMYPELMNELGKWFFNMSVAEQTNGWLGGYNSIIREMLPDKFDFFLDEMIRLRNAEVLKKLEKEGHNPWIL
ncbi:hypothetical protein BYT27DRAFT_7231609 [Phlegmacium glaucopus]|nr:hypothetical protein BYT27DRAFT_7231609 [Phlegmacium glaucopus]